MMENQLEVKAIYFTKRQEDLVCILDNTNLAISLLKPEGKPFKISQEDIDFNGGKFHFQDAEKTYKFFSNSDNYKGELTKSTGFKSLLHKFCDRLNKIKWQ